MRMSLYQNLLLFWLGCFIPMPTYGQYIAGYVDSIPQIRSKDFLQQFPFQEYALYLSQANTAALVKDVTLLEENEGPTNVFLDSIHLIQLQYIQAHPGDYDYMLNYLRMGESLMQLDGITKGYILPAFGDLMLQGLATHLDTGLEKQAYRSSDKELQYLIRRLRENKFFVNVPVSDWNKGVDHLKKGNLGYLFRKVRLKQPLLYYGSLLSLVLLTGLVILKLLRKKQMIDNKIAK